MTTSGMIESLEQQPCDDAISRQAAKNAICDYVCGKGVRCVEHHMCRMKKMISDLPPVTPKQKTGHWNKMVSVYDVLSGEYKRIPYTDEDEKFENVPVYICKCGCEAAKPHNYCPDCGTKMEVEE